MLLERIFSFDAPFRLYSCTFAASQILGNYRYPSDNWLSELFHGAGPKAEARRAKALPLIAQDPTRMLDHTFSGPELPVNETVRRRFFGEE